MQINSQAIHLHHSPRPRERDFSRVNFTFLKSATRTGIDGKYMLTVRGLQRNLSVSCLV